MTEYYLEELGDILIKRPSISLQSNLAPVGYLSATDLSPWLQGNQILPMAYQTLAYDDPTAIASFRGDLRGGALLPLRQSLSVESLGMPITPISRPRFAGAAATPIQIAQPTFVQVASPAAAAIPTLAATPYPTARVVPSVPTMIAAHQPAIRFAQAAPSIVRLPVIRRF